MSNPAPTAETILVAEDSKPNRQILVMLLKKIGYDVIECEDGQVAWDALQNNIDKNIVCVISDIMMPVVDGLGLLQHVRDSEKVEIKNLPFVLVTAVADKDFIVRAKSLNVQGYVLKPVTYARVTSKLTELFPHKKFPQLAA